jgi:hypothetical protein
MSKHYSVSNRAEHFHLAGACDGRAIKRRRDFLAELSNPSSARTIELSRLVPLGGERAIPAVMTECAGKPTNHEKKNYNV